MQKPFILDCPTWDTYQAKYPKLADMFDILGIAEYKYCWDLYL